MGASQNSSGSPFDLINTAALAGVELSEMVLTVSIQTVLLDRRPGTTELKLSVNDRTPIQYMGSYIVLAVNQARK